MTRTVALLILLLLAAVGCGEGRSGGGGANGANGLVGRNVLVDDTGMGDSADGGGWMLVLAADRAPDLWAAVGEPDDLRFARFTIDRDAAEAVGGALVVVDDGGEYALDATGQTLLCRVPPAGSAYGCAVVDLPRSGTVVTSFGEGGFAARVEG